MFNRTVFKKRILFVGIPDMAYIGLDGLLMAGVNIVGVLGPKKNHSMFYDFIINCVGTICTFRSFKFIPIKVFKGLDVSDKRR